MSRENDNFISHLHFVDYDIADNVFRAWLDTDNNLICVVDETIDQYKPNVLLVIGNQDERKWDDILTNDYDMDLELIRPKKDNKYQKLDVEYDGLNLYANLIRAYESGKNLAGAIAALNDFRDAAVRRAAMTRLVAAEDEIEIAADTAQRAEEKLQNLRERRKKLRARLERQRGLVGREPTKQTAARILRTESQIDSTEEKIKRAQKRLENARRRLDTATDDAEAARKLLALQRTPDAPPVDVTDEKTVRTAPKKQTAAAISLPVPEYELQPQGQDMSDSEEVKPLLDQDPEILDEEIAFKPVEFDNIKPAFDAKPEIESEPEPAPRAPEANQAPVVTEQDSVPVPEWRPAAQEETVMSAVEPVPVPQEVLETINSVDVSEPRDVDTTGQATTEQYQNTAAPRPVAPAAVAARPVSPITGAAAPVRPVDGVYGHSKPTIVYYLLLILLIVLSVFTLWLYQKKTGGAPDVVAPIVQPVTPDTISVEPVPELEPIVAPEPEPEPLPEPEPEPVVEPEPEPAAPAADINVVWPNNDVLQAAEPETVTPESEAEVLMRKAPYGVSRATKPVTVAEPAPRVTNVTAPGVVFDDDLVSVPGPGADYVDDDYYQNEADYYYQGNARQGMYYDEPEYDDYSERHAPDSNRQLSIHDGGQYSVTYEDY